MKVILSVSNEGYSRNVSWVLRFYFSGYMDLAIAPINSTDFMTLAFTTDYYVYAQDHQQNFTTIVVSITSIS